MNAVSRKHLFNVVLLTLVVLASMLSACGQSQTKTFTIGVIDIGTLGQPVMHGFKVGMAELGYVEGDNLTYIHEDGGRDLEGVDTAINNLIAADIDLILAMATPVALKVKQATEGSAIPVVFVPVYDPVKSGIVSSLAHPGGNLTGIRGGGVIPKLLEFLLVIAPHTERIFLLHNPDDRSSARSLADLTEAADKSGIELVVSEARTSDEVIAALDLVPENVDAYFHLPSTLLALQLSEIVETAIKHKLPLGRKGEMS